MHVPDLGRILTAELQAQDRAEQGVVAIAAVPDGLDERVGAGELGQRARGVSVIRELVGDIGADLGQDAGAQEEVPDRRGLRVENLFDQVAGD